MLATMKSVLLARWSEIRALFEHALDLPAEERGAWLAEATADAALREAVQALLDREEELGADALDLAAPATAVDAHTAAPPAALGRYRVLRELGRGGMGVVYLAEQDEPRRLVAIKQLHGYGGEAQRARLQREAALLAQLSHPGIARIIDIERDDSGHPRLVMEFVDGSPLSLAAAPLDRGERLALLARIADAVEHAHARGVVHRDLKPSNILVDREGQPKVLDFGIGRALEGSGVTLTETGMLLGTPAYMAPEQAIGEVRVGATADVWSLGAIGYELLTGRLPLPVSGLAPLQALKVVGTDTPPPLSRIDRTLGGDIEVVISTALAREPSQRYASAGAFADDLRRYLASEPIRARRPAAAKRLWLYARRNPVPMAAAALALLGVLAGAALALAFGLNAVRERDRAEAGLVQARETQEALARVFAAGNPAIAGEPDVSFRRVLAAAPAQIESLPTRIRLPVQYTVALAQAQSGDEQSAISGFTAAAALADGLGADRLWAQAQLRRAMLAAEHVDTVALTADIDRLLADPRSQAQPLVRAGLLVNAAALALGNYRLRTAGERLADARTALRAARGTSATLDPTLVAEIEIDLLTTALAGVGSGVEDALTPEQLLAEARTAHARLAPMFAGDHPKPAALSVLAIHLPDAIAGHSAWRSALLEKIDAQIPRLGLTHPVVLAQLRTGAAMSLLQAIPDLPLQRRLLDLGRALPEGSRRRLLLLLQAAGMPVYAEAIGATTSEIAEAHAATCAGAAKDDWECNWAEVVLAQRAIQEGDRTQAIGRLGALTDRATTLPRPLAQQVLAGAAFVYLEMAQAESAMATAEQAIRMAENDAELSAPQRDQLILRLSWLFRPSRCDRVLELVGPLEARLSGNPAVAGDVLARLLSTCEVRAGHDPTAALARLAPWWQRAQDPAIDRMVRFEVINAHLEIHDVLGDEHSFAHWAVLLAELEAAMPSLRTLKLDHMPWIARARHLQAEVRGRNWTSPAARSQAPAVGAMHLGSARPGGER